MDETTGHLEIGKAEKAWFGIAVVGLIAAAGSIYLCYYCQIEEYGKASWPVITAGLGLIIAFCVLTVTLIVGIKALIISRQRRFWPVSTMIISGISLIGLVGILIIGIIL